MAWNNRTTQYISSGKYASVPQWSASASHVKGDLVRQLATPTAGNERVFLCYAAGTSSGSEPSWNLSTGAQTTDGSVSWMEVTGCAALNGDLGNTPNWVAGHGNNPSTSQTVTDAAGTHAFICTVSGTAGSTEPSWDTSAVGNTTTDSGVTWMYIGTASSLTKWAAPHEHIATAMSSNWASNSAVGNVTQFFVGNSHNESNSSGISWNPGSNENNGIGTVHVICVNESGNVPPQSSDITTGAIMGLGSGQSFTMQGYIQSVGMEFLLGGGNTQITIAGDNFSDKEYVNCTFNLGSGGSANLQLASRQSARNVFRNCKLVFGAGGQYINMQGNLRWYGGSIGATGTQISSGNALITNSDCADVLFKGVDVSSALASGAKMVSWNGAGGSIQCRFEDCKMPATITVSMGSHAAASSWMELVRSGADYEYARYNGNGSLVTTTQAVRTAGASDGTTHFAWEITTDATYVNPWTNYLECPPIVTWNTALGSPAAMIDIYGISWDTALPKNNEVWIDVDYMIDSGDTLGARLSTRVSDLMATPTAWSADTSHWDSGASARANSHSYSAGDFIADPASNGRLYLCTTGGTSASSQPGGYASAVDGSSITDGSAVFKAGFRFVMVADIMAAQAGNVAISVCVGKPGTITYVIDPQPIV